MSQGNTTCKTTSLDWYTNTVGETPCQTYQRLRQICNADYTVGSLSTSTPGDRCDDQVASCCCNSVSFALSMLCLNCQQGVGTGVNGDNGIDAGVGAYQIYLGTCSPNTNQSLPNDIQAAVCNEKIKIDDDLYTLFWGDGSWFYIYTRETIQKNQLAKANNTYTHCSSTTISNSTGMNITVSSSATSIIAITSSVITSSTSGVATTQTSSLTAGTISAIAVGGVVAAVLFGSFVFWLLRRWRRREGPPPSHVPNSTVRPEMHPFIQPLTSFPSDGTSAASTSLFQVAPSDSNRYLFASTRTMRGKPTQPEIGNSISTTNNTTGDASASTPPAQSEAFLERHIDGGPFLERSSSGRLPPAYGEQL